MDSIPVSHLPPVKPGLHPHLYLLTSSVQFPWTHWHSLMSVKKRKTLLILYFFHHILYQKGLIYIFLICCRFFGCDLWGEKVSCIGFILDGSIKYTKRNIINKNIHTCITVDTCKARLTLTCVHVEMVSAISMDAWGRLTLIDVCKTNLEIEIYSFIYYQRNTYWYICELSSS